MEQSKVKRGNKPVGAKSIYHYQNNVGQLATVNTTNTNVCQKINQLPPMIAPEASISLKVRSIGITSTLGQPTGKVHSLRIQVN